MNQYLDIKNDVFNARHVFVSVFLYCMAVNGFYEGSKNEVGDTSCSVICEQMTRTDKFHPDANDMTNAVETTEAKKSDRKDPMREKFRRSNERRARNLIGWT